MLFRVSVLAGLAVSAGLAFSVATAEDTVASTTNGAVDGVQLTEPDNALGSVARALGIQFGVQEARSASPRFIAPTPDLDGDRSVRGFEIAATSSAEDTGLPVDVSVRRRASFEVDRNGDINPTREGAEVRIGRGLARLVRPWQTPDWQAPTWYLFAASDDEAITWTPSTASRGSALRYQGDRVEIGDMQAGIAVEVGGIHAAFSYVQRDIQGRYGSAEENFTGVTITRRH